MKFGCVLVLASPARTGACVLALSIAACTPTDDDLHAGPDAGCADLTYYRDSDRDGFGANSETSCGAQAGYVAKSGDCNDASAAIHPMAAEVCDLVDNNCDSRVDDADPMVITSTGTVFFRDADGDGYGTTSQTKEACARPVGYAPAATDCDDDAATVHPNASEVCDFVDNDCDGKTDMADATLDLSTAQTFYRDADNDSYGAGTGMVACSKPSGFVETIGDCDDNDNLSKPGGIEVCDGADNDCDGGNDGTPAQPNRCAALVGSYSGSYTHSAKEMLGNEIVHDMTCTGTGSGALLLTRRPGLQGTFTCVYTGSLTAFDDTQTVTLKATVGLDGAVTGTIEHTYEAFTKRTYNVTGTQTPGGLTLTGTGSLLPNQWATVPWKVTFNFAATR